ncbi:MAG: nucleotidyl transferase AbiEii/AbiGii toxin family protein [Patescibacteria group bacterium]|nr:nucleotidyl transferase AbiEii/AbiGii toxin family protein [Patescibacteria group bacterium]
MDLHFDILPKSTRSALEYLSLQEWLKDSNWYLAGGTALALQVGHRQSVDLDFFTIDRDFNNDQLLQNFFDNKDWKTDINSKGTVYGELMNAKVSFIAYPFFLPSEERVLFGFIRILIPNDIAVMKVVAISQRGRKRDFIDLYWLMNNGQDLESVIRRLGKQYPSVAHDYHHILKSLVYFNDAEGDPMPELRFRVKWEDVKKYFESKVPAVAKKVVGLQ